jgi:hypothetical protein
MSKKTKKALDNNNVGGNTDIPAKITMWRITSAMTHMSFTHYTLMGMQQDVTILNRYGVEHVVENVEQPMEQLTDNQ